MGGQPGAPIPSAPRLRASYSQTSTREGEPTPPTVCTQEWNHNRVMRWARDPEHLPAVYSDFVDVIETYQLDGTQLMGLSPNMLAEMMPGKKSFEIILLQNLLSKQFGTGVGD